MGRYGPCRVEETRVPDRAIWEIPDQERRLGSQEHRGGGTVSQRAQANFVNHKPEQAHLRYIEEEAYEKIKVFCQCRRDIKRGVSLMAPRSTLKGTQFSIND